MSTLPEDPRNVLDDLRRAAAAKWKGDPAAQQWGLFARAAAEIERLQADAARYRWLRTAGAWESEIGMEVLSEDPAKFDAAIDAAIAASASRAERA